MRARATDSFDESMTYLISYPIQVLYRLDDLLRSSFTALLSNQLDRCGIRLERVQSFDGVSIVPFVDGGSTHRSTIESASYQLLRQ